MPSVRRCFVHHFEHRSAILLFQRCATDPSAVFFFRTPVHAQPLPLCEPQTAHMSCCDFSHPNLFVKCCKCSKSFVISMFLESLLWDSCPALTRTGRLFCRNRSPCSNHWICCLWLGQLGAFAMSSNLLNPILSSNHVFGGIRGGSYTSSNKISPDSIRGAYCKE